MLNNKQNFNIFIWSFLKNKKLWFLGWFLIEIIIDFLGIFVAQYFNKQAINYFKVEDPILKSGLLLVFLYVFFNEGIFLIKLVRMKMRDFSLSAISNTMKNSLFNYTIQHSINYFNNSFSGAISSKISSVAEETRLIFIEAMKITRNSIIFIFAAISFYFINIYIAICFIVFSLLTIIIIFKGLKNCRLSRKIVSERYSQHFGFIVDNFVNIRNIKIFSNSFQEMVNSKKSILNIRKAEKKMMQNQVKNQLTLFIGTFLLIFSIVCSSSILLAKTLINYGDFLYIIMIASITRHCLIRYVRAFQTFAELKGSIENGLETIYKPIEINNKNNEKLVIKEGKIIFKNIIFKYNISQNN